VVKLARQLSVRAVERLAELMESEDERVAAVACGAILDRAFGKPQTHPDQDSEADRVSELTPQQREQFANEIIADLRAIAASARPECTP